MHQDAEFTHIIAAQAQAQDDGEDSEEWGGGRNKAKNKNKGKKDNKYSGGSKNQGGGKNNANKNGKVGSKEGGQPAPKSKKAIRWEKKVEENKQMQ